ncbi:MAG TPA: diaminopimelate decarboxylase [Candidatus Acidoferrales bacterium]|nr:diaminopimelate decarboxylase [Candidatus Acidoferrales bacterium]
MGNKQGATFLDPQSSTPQFSYNRESVLCCERVSLAAIAERVGTPAYIYSRAAFAGAYRRFRRAMRGLPHTICYAVKANSNLAILREFARMGSNFDIVSGGELYRLQRIGVPGKRIVFSGVGKTREEIRDALRARILLFNVESAAELELLAGEAARLRRVAPVAIRVNPDIEAGGHPHIATGHHRHKFGVDWPEARRLYLFYLDSLWINWQGISAHIGSQIASLRPFRSAATRLAGYFRMLSRAGIALRYLDFGGGLGIRYTNEDPPTMEAFARLARRAFASLGCQVLFEPGRALIGPAGILLTRVLYSKTSRGKTFVVVDAAMNDLIRPALYGAAHPITPIMRPPRDAQTERVDIVGPVCESGDAFLHNWPMPEVKSNDLLAIWGAGAYGFVESSNYNSRPRAPEVLVTGNRFGVVRSRESHSDLIRGEKIR